jgi:hypothetical protein
MNKLNFDRKKMVIVFVIVLVLIGIYKFFIEERSQTYSCTCPLEYGKPECKNQTLYIPFYNPNEFSVENIRLSVKTSRGEDIYNVDKPLGANETQVLLLPQCYDINNVKVKWCCAVCCEAPLKYYSGELQIK